MRVLQSATIDTLDLSSTRAFLVCRNSKDKPELQFWKRGGGWQDEFSVECLFDSRSDAHRVIADLPPGGDPNYDHEIIPVSLSAEHITDLPDTE